MKLLVLVEGEEVYVEASADLVGATLPYFDEHGVKRYNTLLAIEHAKPAPRIKRGKNRPYFLWFCVNERWTLYGDQSIWKQQGDGTWNVTHASLLKVGDVVFDDHDQPVPVTSITREKRYGERWWRLHVSGDASFIADGITLHNASRFWRGGSGTWDGSTTTNWSALDGGSGGASAPTTSDNANWTALSNATAYTVTSGNTGGNPACADLNMNVAPATSGTITWAGSDSLTVAGSYALLAGMTRTYVGIHTFNSTSTGKTINVAGVTMDNGWTFNGVGGGWTISANVTSGATRTITITNGALDTNGKTMSFGTWTTGASGSLTLGASAITCSLANNGTPWNVTAGATFSGALSSITFVARSGGSAFAGGSNAYGTLTVTGVVTGFSLTISGSNSFTTLSITGGATAGMGLVQLQSSTTTTVSTSLVLNANSVINRLKLQAATGGTAAIINAAAVTLSDVNFADITAGGAAAPWTGTRLGDAKNNSGITFAVAANKFYRGNTANWHGTVWALTTAGAAAANNFPLPQDTALFTTNSFSANGQTMTISVVFDLPTIDFTGMTNRTGITFATGALNLSLFGDLKLSSAGTFATSGTGNLSFTGVGAIQNLQSNGVAFTQNILANGSPVSLVDNFTGDAAKAFSVVFGASGLGSLDLNGKTLTCGSVTTWTGTIKDTAGGGRLKTITTSAGSVMNVLGTATRSTWDIEVGGNTATVRSISLNSKTMPAIIFSNTTANGGLDLIGSGTLKSVTISNPPQTLRITAAATITFEDSIPTGTAAGNLTWTSITGANHNVAMLTNPNTVNADYLTLSRSQATPASTFFAGHHSTDSGNNSGWTFGDGFASNISDAGAAADLVDYVVGIPASITEADSFVADSLTAATVLAAAVSETGTAADTVAGAAVEQGAVTDAGAVTDVLGGAVELGGAVTEAGAATDALAAVTTLTAAITEAGATVDVVAGASDLPAAITEAGAATDAITGLRFTPGDIVEVGAATDLIAVAATTWNATLEEAPTLLDDVSVTGTYNVAIDDLLAAMDTLDARRIAIGTATLAITAPTATLSTQRASAVLGISAPSATLTRTP